MIYFAKNSGQKPGSASLEYPLFHGSLPPYGYQAVTNVDFAGLNDYFYSPTGWETFIIPTRNHVSDMPNAGDLPASAAELKKLCHSYEKKLSRQDEKIQMLNDELSRMKLEKKALLQKLKELVNEFNS